jgi:hypothetical protein
MGDSRPTVYLDTNVLSVLHYRGGDPIIRHQHLATRGWWEVERPYFKVLTSRLTEDELRGGKYLQQRRAIADVRKLTYLPYWKEVATCAKVFREKQIVPEGKDADAYQLAFATVFMIDYLLTWNHAHLVNEDTVDKLEVVARSIGKRPPLLVSPLSIPKRSLGQEIRRKKDAPKKT